MTNFLVLHAVFIYAKLNSMAMVLMVYSKWIDGAGKSKERGKINSMFGGMATRSLQEKAATL